MQYYNDKLNLKSDFKIRTVKKEFSDRDLFIHLDNRVVNFNFPLMPDYIHSRFQFTCVSTILIRYNQAHDNTLATIHLLRSVDMATALMNFEIDYKDLGLEILDREGFVDFNILKQY